MDCHIDNPGACNGRRSRGNDPRPLCQPHRTHPRPPLRISSIEEQAIGMYGVTACSAGSRVTEIGVRMALGANPPEAAAIILRGALGLILVGLILGLPLTFAARGF